VRYMSALKEAGRIERVGGKRYGHKERDDFFRVRCQGDRMGDTCPSRDNSEAEFID